MNRFARIEDVLITELKQICDDRGSVLHMMRCDAPEFDRFGECYFSEVLPGAVKAWKLHHQQTQNLAVPIGRIRLVIYDDRQGSSTRGNVQEIVLGRPDAYFRVRLPQRLWYGFSCVSATPALLANFADQPHDPAEAESRDSADPEIPYSWLQVR